MSINTVFYQLFLLFIPVLIGYALIRGRVNEQSFMKNLSLFIFHVTLPCSVVNAMQFEFDKSILNESLLIIFISVGAVLVSYIVGIITARALKSKKAEKGIILFSVVFSNFSFMGYPIAHSFMGEKGLFYATVFSIPLYFFVQSLGLSFLKDDEEKGFSIKSVVNPPMIGVFVGFALFLTGIKLPSVLQSAVTSFASMTTPLAMLLVGMSLTAVPLKNVFSDFKFYIVAFLRLIALPLLFYFMLGVFGVDQTARQITATITMMPVAANIIITLTRHGRDATDAAKAVFITCLLSVITIPVMWTIIF